MPKLAWFFAALFATVSSAASAACPTFHTLSNGTTADANAVMDNFNYILQCPSFTAPLQISTTGAAVNTISAVIGSASSGYSGGLGFKVNPISGTDFTAAIVSGENSTNTGATDGGKLFLWTAAEDGSHTLIKRMTINGVGNVGIGTTSPLAPLHIYGTGAIASTIAIKVGSASSGYAGGLGFTVNPISGTDFTAAMISGENSTNTGSTDGGRLFLWTAAEDGSHTLTKRMTINGVGHVGIATTTPNFNGYPAGNSVLSIYGTYQGVIELASGGSPADGNINGDLAFENTNLISSKRLAIVRATVSGTASNDAGGQIEFYTKANAGGLARAMSITNQGKVGIGTTTPAQALEVNGQIKVNSLASASGTALCINASVIASCSSSRRYKEQIRDANFGLKEIEEMRPVTFKWKGRDERDFGLIAEEVAKIDPQYVTYKGGKIEGVKYAQLTGVLINAVKELKAANDQQATEIQQLKIHMSALEKKSATKIAANR